MRLPRLALLLLVLLLSAACATGGKQVDALQRAQYAYSAAIRWGDIEGAWALLDPAWRQAHPLTAIERERYNQVQVSAYRPVSSEAIGEGQSLRVIEIGVVNRNTMTERQVRYAERWRYDVETRSWYVTSGLPDFWSGH
ncbi:hypothetical protein [Luteimonas sp. e5]